jgi:CIC family chloride channel protein
MIRHRLGDLFRLFIASLLTGVFIGALGTLFRAALALLGHAREFLTAQAHATPVQGVCAVVIGTGIAAILARWLVVRFAPIAAGSGVQHVEAVMRGEAEPAGLAVIPVKFFGGLLAIGAGMPLGREGPTVQMGAVVGDTLAALIVRVPESRRAVEAAGAGGGLAVAFNAPLGGTVFVFEELTRNFVPRQILATLAAASVAMAIMRFALGEQSLFVAGTGTDQPLAQLPFHFALGTVLGIIGAGYAWLTTAFLDVLAWFRAVPSLLKAGAIGMIVGLTGWFFPGLIGGGEVLAQQILSAPPTLDALLLILTVRILLGPLAYTAGAPGGLFAPLLVIGAATGALCADALAVFWPTLAPSPLVLSVVGMAAMFTAVVRAPLTGIVLTIEMTGRADCSLAMLTACLAATLLASFVGSRPVYDVLRERMLKRT